MGHFCEKSVLKRNITEKLSDPMFVTSLRRNLAPFRMALLLKKCIWWPRIRIQNLVHLAQ